MPTNYAVKSTAKVTLKKLWPEAIVASVCLGINAVLASIIQTLIAFIWSSAAAVSVSVLYFCFITAPLLIGVIYWLWRVTVLSDSPVTEIFYPFSSKLVYARTMSFVVAAAIRLIPLFLIVMLPFGAVKLISNPQLYAAFDGQMPAWTANFWIFEGFLKYIGIAVFMLIVLRHYLAPLLFVAGSDITAGEAIYMSRRIGALSFGAMLQLVLSFAGWAVLSLLIIPAIYTLPYFLVCMVIHCRYAINYYNSKQKQEGYSYTPPSQDFGAGI